MMWTKIFGKRQKLVVRDGAGLRVFLDREAAFLSQQTSIEYSRARSGLLSMKLFSEQAFLDALDVCRWEAFAAVLADMVVILEGRLRPHAGSQVHALHLILIECYRDVLLHYPLPAHRSEGWQDALSDITSRLAQAQLGSPKPPHVIATVSGNRLFESLPFHTSVRRNDKEMVVNSVRFGMIRFCERAEAAIDRPQLAAALLGGPRTAADHA